MASERCPPCPEPGNCYCDQSVRLQEEFEGRARDGIVQGHVLDVLARLPVDSVSCVPTSPPYWSLRKYAAPDVVWGGDPDCPHTLDAAPMQGEGYTGSGRWQHSGVSRQETPDAWVKEATVQGPKKWDTSTGQPYPEQTTDLEVAKGATCSRCGAWRGQFGLEPTPELYVEHTLDVLRAIRRVLRPDGVVWWNIGDGYSHGGAGARDEERWPKQSRNDHMPVHAKKQTGLKPKDLILMPQRIALAAQADGWWVRSMIVWSKPNAMPESVTDRPSNAHEYVLMLTKSARYWYDQEAVREASTSPEQEAHNQRYAKPYAVYDDRAADTGQPGNVNNVGIHSRPGPGGRNMRDVWTFPTAQTPEAHFATLPEELPRRCIEASCPREICTACGKARLRLVETEYVKNRPSAGDDPRSRKEDKLSTAGAHEGYSPHRGYRGNNLLADTATVGWSDCGCGAAYEPGIVLDPFAGIGTTGIVAKRLGRRFIGIELSEEYAEMARKKLSLWWRKATLTEGEASSEQVAMEL